MLRLNCLHFLSMLSMRMNAKNKQYAFLTSVPLVLVLLVSVVGTGRVVAQTAAVPAPQTTMPVGSASGGLAAPPAQARRPALRPGEIDPRDTERQRLAQAYAKRLFTEAFAASTGPETHLMRAPYESGTRYQKLTATERADIARHAQTIADAIARTPGATAPRDLYPWLKPGDDGTTTVENLGAGVLYGAYAPMWITGTPQTGLKRASGAETSFFNFRVNRVLNVGESGFSNDGNFPVWKDADGQFSAEPHVIEVGSGPLVVDDHLLLLPPGAAHFKRVSMERALTAQLAVLNQRLKLDATQREQAAKELADFLGAPAVQVRQAQRDAQYQAAVARGAAERALTRLRNELDREDQPHTNRLTKSAQVSVEAQEVMDAQTLLENQLASLDSAAKAAPACLRSEPGMWRSGPANWRFGEQPGETCTPLVQTHPALLKQVASNRAEPRLLAVRLRGCTSGLNAERFGKIASNHPQELNCRNLLVLLQEIDWAALRLALYR